MRRVREPWSFKVPPVCQQWYCSLRKTKHEISVLLLKLLTFDLYSFICSTTAIFICYMCLSCGLCGNLQHGVDHTCTVNRKWLIYRKYLNQGLIVIMILKKRKLNMGHIFVTTRNLRFVLRVLKPRRLNTDTLCSPLTPPLEAGFQLHGWAMPFSPNKRQILIVGMETELEEEK